MAANADSAAATLLPQMLAMACWTLEPLTPHTAVRFGVYGCSLTAARRHAGGVARTGVERTKREKARVVMLVNMVESVCLLARAIELVSTTLRLSEKNMW